MIRGLNPDLTNEQIMELMRATCVDLGDPGHDIYYGYGQIDIAGALQTAVNGGGAIPRQLVNQTWNAGSRWYHLPLRIKKRRQQE